MSSMEVLARHAEVTGAAYVRHLFSPSPPGVEVAAAGALSRRRAASDGASACQGRKPCHVVPEPGRLTGRRQHVPRRAGHPRVE